MPALPTGTITFLFTDIEGSTKLWEQFPDQMRAALARHDALLRDAIEQNNGHVFKTVGDAFCAAFSIAPDALHAALAAQQALISEPWPEPVTIRVRMALHTGAVESRDNDYFGQPLNRVARLLSTGHGGQVLISGVACDLVRDNLPASISLQEMGKHRMRDLNRPETVFQLLHPELPSDFPPLKSLDYLPNNLPLQLTSFVGREKEIAEITAMLSKTRLLTLTGSGGAGKTRLSLQVAGELLDQFTDGVWLVELASLSDPSLVPQTVASALNLTEQAGKTYTQILIDYLHPKSLLLILDNCEHLLSACAQFSDALLRACSNLEILASSREALGIAGEQTYRVPSLSLPDSKENPSVETISQYEAVRLFIERAASTKHDFGLTSENASIVASLCHRLDGIPLAIELAAARVRALSVEEINTRLDNRFRLLTGGSKTALPRQQTLRALIDWSYDLLSPQEKLLLSRLSVFAGGWTLEAAEQVCAGESAQGESIEDWEVLDLLTSLADKSLVLVETQGEATRYRLLETVRQYARDRLVESEESTAVRARHTDYFLSLAEGAATKLQGHGQKEALETLEIEHDNLRSALAWCQEEPGRGETGLRLGCALWRFWYMRGYWKEGSERLAAILDHPGTQERTQERGTVLNAAGNLTSNQGHYEQARVLYEQALAIRQELGHTWGIAGTLMNLCNLAKHRGDYSEARILQEESLCLYEQVEDKAGIAASLANLGMISLELGDYAAARTSYEQALAVNRQIGNRTEEAFNLTSLGNLARMQNDCAAAHLYLEEALLISQEIGSAQAEIFLLNSLGNLAYEQSNNTSAQSYYEQALAFSRQIGNREWEANSLGNLGNVAAKQEDYPLAHSFYSQGLRLSHQLRAKKTITEYLTSFASLHIQQGQPEQAARLYGAAQALSESMGAPLESGDQGSVDDKLAALRTVLDEAAFAATWEEGRAMTMEQAVEYALKDV